MVSESMGKFVVFSSPFELSTLCLTVEVKTTTLSDVTLNLCE